MSKPDGARKAKTEAVVPPRIARSSTPKEEQGSGSSDQGTVYNILLVGETGVGKSTCINAFMNYLNFPTLQDALDADTIHAPIPSKFTITDNDFNTRVIEFGNDPNESFRQGESQTQSCRSYTFRLDNLTVRWIDTPGVGDTRGLQNDESNFLHLLQYLGEFPHINAIVILLKPNESKVNVLFEYCIKQLLASLERSAIENIVFVFTNARGTFYNPGDTVISLRKVLRDIAETPPNVDVPFGCANTFCVDNEAFRYLLAKRQGCTFDQRTQQSFVESWNTSADVCRSLLRYIMGLTAHEIQNTVSLMEARKTIERLRKPLAEIAQLVEDNIRRITRLEMELSDNTKRLKDLAQYLNISRMNLTVNKLEHPMTVCAETSCTDAYKVEDSTKIHYRTVCHERCYLNGVPGEVRGDPHLQGCTAMSRKLFGTATCNHCKHSYLQHMHIYYTTTPYNETHKDPRVEGDIEEREVKKADIEKALERYHEDKMAYEGEREVILMAVAKFAHFLKNNAILPYNDAYKKYLEYLVEREKSLGNLAKQHLIDSYEKLIAAYEEQKKVLDEALTKARQDDASINAIVTAADIAKIIQELYSLPLTGKTLKEMYEAQQMHRATESVAMTEKVMTFIKSKKEKVYEKAKNAYNWLFSTNP